MMNLTSIPAELKSLNRWILWRKETRNGQTTKIPVSLQGVPVSVTDPKHWLSFEQAARAFNPKQHSGLGYVLTKEDGICCIDLDDAIDESGNICPEAMQIVERLNSWTEISQSKKGLHIFVRGTKPTTRAKVAPKTFKSLEIYDHARYIAITANHLQGTPLTVEARQAELNALCEKYFSPETHAGQSPEKPRCNELSDEEIIALCRRAKNGDKFSRLFDYGDVSAYGNDESRADAALCSMLAFYTTDPVQIENIFSRSALARRAKWRERADYRRKTIENAIAQVREHYTLTNRTSDLTSKYPMQNLNGHTPEPIDEDETELPELDSYANIDFAFDESLVPSGLFREVYNHFKSEADAPPQFIFTATLATFMAICGTRLSLTCGAIKVKPHDYFALLTKSGNGKSTSLETCRAVLDAFEKKIVNKPYSNVVLFPQSSTLRGLLDCMREESEFELRARETAEAKGKPTLPPKVAQRSGVAIIDEVSALFDSTRNEFNSGLDATLLLLWDGAPRMIATSAKNDGKMKFEDSALTLLSASTPKKFVERLPKGAMLDGMIPRFQIVFADNRKQPRKALTSLAKSQADHDAIVDKLLSFFQFVCTMSSKPVIVSDEAKSLDEQSVQKWYEESLRLDDETADGYMQRIDIRKMRYALLFSALETYDQHGQFADGITISGTAMERAIKVCEFFKAHALHFIQQQSDTIDEKGLDQIGRTKLKLVKLLRERFRGEAKRRTLFQFSHVGKVMFEAALNELMEVGQVRLETRPNAKNRPVDFVVLTKPPKEKNSVAHATLATLATLSKINLTETQAKPQNEGKCSVATQSVASDFSSEPTVPTNPVPTQPTVSPEPTASDAASLEPPVPTPAAKPELSLSDSDLAEVVMCNLRQTHSRKQIHGSTIRQTLNTICGERADDVGRLLYPKYLLRLGKTPYFVLKDERHRPPEFKELIPDSDGVLPPDPAPF